jgi:DNA-binding NtrC family response regulator
MNVAYVEDDEMLREVFARQFRKLFQSIEVYHDAQEALLGLRQAPKDIVFCDLWMPKIDGVTFYKEFRKFDQTTPFVFITGELEIEKKLEELTQEKLFWLPKPCRNSDMEKLLEKIKIPPSVF